MEKMSFESGMKQGNHVLRLQALKQWRAQTKTINDLRCQLVKLLCLHSIIGLFGYQKDGIGRNILSITANAVREQTSAAQAV